MICVYSSATLPLMCPQMADYCSHATYVVLNYSVNLDTSVWYKQRAQCISDILFKRHKITEGYAGKHLLLEVTLHKIIELREWEDS